MATLYVADRDNNWYGGYIEANGVQLQVFNVQKSILETTVQPYIDLGYTPKYLNKEQTKEFILNKIALEEYMMKHNVVFD